MTVDFLVVALALALLLPPIQEPTRPVSEASPAAEAAVPTLPETVAQQATSGLPQRPQPPRTLHSYWPVFVGFAVVWVGMMGYLLTFNRRMSRIARSLDQPLDRTGDRVLP